VQEVNGTVITEPRKTRAVQNLRSSALALEKLRMKLQSPLLSLSPRQHSHACTLALKMLDDVRRDTLTVALGKLLRHTRPATEQEEEKDSLTGRPRNENNLAVFLVNGEAKLCAALPMRENSRLRSFYFVLLDQIELGKSPVKSRAKKS